MSGRRLHQFVLLCCTLALAAFSSASAHAGRPPNFIIILADDLGYGDLGCYGSEKIDTPQLDRMASEGLRLTDFYATAPICTPTRASLMTGCYPSRVGLGTPLHTPDRIGLNPEEVTIAELLQSKGYATACIGKWHLGHQPDFYPTRHGFDYYYGTPLGHCFRTERMRKRGRYSDLFLRNETRVPFPPDEQLTQELTAEALEWIKSNREQPFFLYLSHPMPHGPVAASEKFRGQSQGGVYGDAVETIDWSTGEILQTLRELQLDQDTIVVFTSDNGADDGNWGVPANWFGSNAPLRGKKQQAWEGGLRVPCIAWGPGHLPSQVVLRELTSVMDFLPTFSAMAGAKLPEDRVIDGKDIRSLLMGETNAQSPYDAFIYHARFGKRAGIRMGKWKLLVDVDATTWHHQGSALYDLSADPGETSNLAKEHPEVVKRLRRRLDKFEQDLETNYREPGRSDE